MKISISLLLFFVFIILSAIHFYWIAGGKWGTESVFPSKDNNTKPIMPGFIPTIIVALGFLILGFFVLLKANILSFKLPILLEENGLWILALIFIIRAIGEFRYIGFFKKVKNTKFGINDTKYYSPLSFTIGVLLLLLEFYK